MRYVRDFDFKVYICIIRNRLVPSQSIDLITATEAMTDTRVHDFCSGKVEEILAFYQNGYQCWNSEMFSWHLKSGNLHIDSTKTGPGLSTAEAVGWLRGEADSRLFGAGAHGGRGRRGDGHFA